MSEFAGALVVAGLKGSSTSKLERLRRSVALTPEDPEAHYRLAEMYAFRRDWVTAIGEYRTAMTLGRSGEEALLSLAKAYVRAGLTDLALSTCDKVLALAEGFLARKALSLRNEAEKAPSRPLDVFNHNRYFRLKTIADHIRSLYGGEDIALLDVGGGDGALSLFLPEARYVLAEPATNGISADAFAPKFFDAVVACHVLEHVSGDARSAFLEMLSSRARKHVLLLNPFFDPDGFVTERLKLIIELTGAQWAKEHLDCALPGLDEVEQFAADHKYDCKVYPNGSLPTTLAMVFLDNYTKFRKDEMKRINHFYNTLIYDRLICPEFPTAHLVEISLVNERKTECLRELE
jgi:hypothetical protein